MNKISESFVEQSKIDDIQYIRDMLATAALQGMLANGFNKDYAAEQAYDLADKVLKHR